MVVPTLLQLSFSCGIAIVDTPVVVFGGCCSLWFHGCCCTPCFDFQSFLEIFGSFFNFYSQENQNRFATFFDLSQQCLFLSFKLLPNRNSDSVGTSLVKETSFGGKILDQYCLLMFCPSRFAIPRKVKLSVQILILDK